MSKRENNKKYMFFSIETRIPQHVAISNYWFYVCNTFTYILLFRYSTLKFCKPIYFGFKWFIPPDLTYKNPTLLVIFQKLRLCYTYTQLKIPQRVALYILYNHISYHFLCISTLRYYFFRPCNTLKPYIGHKSLES